MKRTFTAQASKYSRVLNKHVGLNKSIGRKIMEKQIIVLVGINMLVGIIKVLVGTNGFVCKGKSSKNQFDQMQLDIFMILNDICQLKCSLETAIQYVLVVTKVLVCTFLEIE